MNAKEIRGRLREQLLQLDALLPLQIRRPLVPGSGLRLAFGLLIVVLGFTAFRAL